MRRFEDAQERYKKGRLTAEEAGDLLGLSGATFAASACVTRPRVSRVCVTSGSGGFPTACAGERAGPDATSLQGRLR